jgi:hypothetical protein
MLVAGHLILLVDNVCRSARTARIDPRTPGGVPFRQPIARHLDTM